MRIGVPKEIKPQENRIGLTPESVKVLTSNGHEVLVESNGGYEAGFDDEQYKKSGAKIVNKAEDIFNDDHTKNRKSIIEIEHFDTNKKPFRVAANPVRFKGYNLKLDRPPKLGEHNNHYFKKK